MSALYAEAARLRRSWYRRRPDRRRSLPIPVISVGNLSVGGSGKTPVVAALAGMLAAAGERPVVLSRGYARRERADGVLVVSDTQRVLARVEQSGDEPLMLARELPGVPVLVSPDRYLAGCLAHRLFQPTVVLVDDGFQHLQLARDVDLLVVSGADLQDRVLPAGRLRESPAAALDADAAIFEDGPPADAGRYDLPIPTFTLRRRAGALRAIHGRENVLPAADPGTPVFAVAGIARPERFLASVRAERLPLAGQLTFPDHHWYSARDVARVVEAARTAGASLVVTTAKDAVRLEALVADVPPHTSLRWAVLPLAVTIEPAAEFAAWLWERL